MTLVKSSHTSLIAVALLLGFACSAHAAGEILWFKDLRQASAAAIKADVPMFIDFWADWCAPCKVMDTEVYTNPRVQQLFPRKVIGVRVHFDLQKELVRRFGVEALPHLVFTTSHGTPLISHRGTMTAQELVDVVNALPPLSRLNILDRRLQESKDDLGTIVDMGRELRSSGFFAESTTYYRRALGHRGSKADTDTRESVLYDMALNALDLRDGKEAATILERCLKEFPGSPRRAEFAQALARARQLTGAPEKAR
jgi:thioredoxin-like negative regulator of GroEL